MKRLLVLVAIASMVVSQPALAVPPPATTGLVTVGSPTDTTPQNHQNEPAVAMDAHQPNVLAAGVNDFLDWQPCPQATATQQGTCRGSNVGVGLSGVYFSFDSGKNWVQPTYTGLTSRDCTANGPCTPHTGSIGTLPWYAEAGLASNGDPAVAFGPKPLDGTFSWSNGSRLYYANLTGAISAGFPRIEPFHGQLAVGVSRLDNPTPSSVLLQNSWMPPVIASSRTSSTSFEDKEQIWADNAETSPFFGNVYACVDDFRSLSRGAHTMQKSTDGGKTWTRPLDILPANDACFNIDFVEGRCVADGGAGARIDLLSAPSVDIANGAPTGADATDEIVDVWNDGSLGLNHEKTLFSYSMNGGAAWSSPAIVSVGSDRPIYAAPAIAPDGSAVYVMYEALTDPWRGGDFTSSRGYHGIFRTSPLNGSGTPTAWSILLTGPLGDIRATYPGHDIYQERVGDYVYAAASRTYGVGVWADASDASVCTPVQTWRAASYAAGQRVLPGAPWPVPPTCPADWGNVQILAVTNAP